MKTLGILEADTLYPDLLAEYQSYGNMLRRFCRRTGKSLRPFLRCAKRRIAYAFCLRCPFAHRLQGGVYDDLPWLAPLASWITRAYGDGEN